MSKYKEFSGLNLPSIEKEILAKWDETNAFQQSIDLKEGATPFVFYEGYQVPMVCQAFIMLFQEL
jgi:isoleucyl-tRNA synthetase